MKIDSLEIANFKAIESAVLKNLGGLVVIAGQNGSGKSAIFDAIRLLKTAYGGYQANEFQQWLGEMQIDFKSPSSVLSIFGDKKEKLSLRMMLTLDKEESDYLLKNAQQLVAFAQQTAGPWGLGDMRSRFISKEVNKYQKVLKAHEAEAIEA